MGSPTKQHTMAHRLLAATIVSAAAAAAPFSASYRKDRWLPQYIEFGVPEPLDGGRLHIVGLASASGRPGAVTLNGSLVNVSVGVPLPADWPVDWLRVEPATGLVAGQPFFVALHSRAPAWDAALAGSAAIALSVADAGSPGGAALANGSFVVAASPVAITWVTTARMRADVHVFMRNSGGAPATVARAVFSGVDVTGALPPAALTLAAGATAMWVLPAAAVGGAAAVAEGAVWTMQVEWAGGKLPASAAGGLLFREFFPIETWYHGPDCPFPGFNNTAYAEHRTHGIDTFFAEFTFDAACNTTLTSADLVNTIAPQNGFFVLPSFEGGLNYAAVTNQSALVGVFLADEDDTVVDDKARSLLAAVLRARVALPAQPTYSGGASNRYTGAYAGITDVKGMDAYIGACAPHYALLDMPARGSFDYLANTRANHAPGPTWLYSQGLWSGWDGSLLKTNRQANAAEMAVQVASVAAAGGKGLTLFETELKYLADPVSAPTWATLGTLLREMGALRELYRAGDAMGTAVPLDVAGASLAATVLAEAMLHPRGVVVLAINTAAVNDTYNDICCALDVEPCHFTFVDSAVASLAVALPPGFDTIVDAFEVFNATVLPGSPAVRAPFPNATLALTGVALGTEGPGSASCSAPASAIVRTFVLAFDASLRSEVAAALAGGPPAATVAGVGSVASAH